MSGLIPPLIAAALLWWVGTGVVAWLDGRAPATFQASLLWGALAGIAGLAGLAITAADDSATGAYVAFFCALTVWGFLEMTFLMGVITGPRRTTCPPDVRGWRRFFLAAETVLHHEVAILAATLTVVALTIGQPNQAGAGAFIILAVMRLSAKLNVFLGVPYLSDELLPPHLSYLKTYFGKRAINALIPVSLIGGAVLTIGLAQAALAAPSGSGPQTEAMLLAALAGLAVLEHAMMLAPVPDALLWRWALPARATPSKQTLNKKTEGGDLGL